VTALFATDKREQCDNFIHSCLIVQPCHANPKPIRNKILSRLAQRLTAAIAILEARKSQIESEGEVAPAGCYVARYQARGQQRTYWYYKLQAQRSIFPTTKGQKKCSRYKHLGAAGSVAHVDAVIQVVRRVQIDELTRAIDSLKQSWADLYPETKKPSETKKNLNQHSS